MNFLLRTRFLRAWVWLGPALLCSFDAGAQYIYATNSSQITIIGYVPNTVTSLHIPATINGLPVTAINADAFENFTNLTVVDMNVITNIGDGAFINCVALASAPIPTTVNGIGLQVFENCG